MLKPIHCRFWNVFGVLSLVSLALGQSSLSVNPPSIPIVLRSPYFNTWISTLANGTVVNPPDLGGVRLWNAQAVGWTSFIRVDKQLYGWLGVGGVDNTTTLASYVTPTQTIFTLQTGPVDVNVTFLSPVEPTDYALQSFPFSYLSIDVISRDGSEHSVQVYVDLTGEWISSNLNSTTQSSTSRGDSVVYHSTTLTNPSFWVEQNDIAQDETLILASANSNALTTQAGPSASIRAAFGQSGQLSDSIDGTNLPISPSFPAVAMAIDLGTIASTPSPSPALFALGIVRDPLIRYGHGSAVDLRRPYWTTQWSNISAALDHFISDYPAALRRAQSLDAKVMSDARGAASTQYADLVALSVRQVFAAIDITTPPNGTVGDVKGFMKDIGIGRRANPVDTLYASLPALLYFNASLGGILLDPLLEAQSTADYQHGFAGPDLGSMYPTTAANNSDTQTLGVDDCASMLIMTWLYTQKSGNGTLIELYYPLLKQWADYLVQNTLRPAGFYTSDGLNNPDNSNLALKGILGVYAMSQINKALEGRGMLKSTTQYYANVSQTYYNDWEGLAFSSGRVVSSYNQPSSWAMAYNLYPAMLMGVDFIGNNVYDGQTSFYSSQFASSGSKLGLGYDSNDQYTVKSHWSLFTAATVTSTTVRDAFITSVHNRTFMTGVFPPFSTTWDLRSGGSPPVQDGRASAAQGAMFSLLALKVPNVAITFNGAASSKGTNVGAIAGGAVGGMAVVAFGIITFLLARRRNRERGLKVNERAYQPAAEVPIPTFPVPALIAPTPMPMSQMSDTAESTMGPPLLSRLFRGGGQSDSSSNLLPSPFTLSPGSPTSAEEGEEGEGLPRPTFPSADSRVSSASEKRAIRARLASQATLSGSSVQQGASPDSESFPTPSSQLEHSTAWSGMGQQQRQQQQQKKVLGGRFISEQQSMSSGSTGSITVGGSVSSRSDELKAEVVELRRQMAEIQAMARGVGAIVRERHTDEPPPSYS